MYIAIMWQKCENVWVLWIFLQGNIKAFRACKNNNKPSKSLAIKQEVHVFASAREKRTLKSSELQITLVWCRRQILTGEGVKKWRGPVAGRTQSSKGPGVRAGGKTDCCRETQLEQEEWGKGREVQHMWLATLSPQQSHRTSSAVSLGVPVPGCVSAGCPLHPRYLHTSSLSLFSRHTLAHVYWRRLSCLSSPFAPVRRENITAQGREALIRWQGCDVSRGCDDRR